MVAVWQQDRWNDGGARGLVSAVSDDGGADWETVDSPAFSLCSGGEFERASDPWVTYAADGGVYFMSLSVDLDPDPFAGRDAMLVAKSTDGGHTWGAPVTLIEDDDPNVLNDKNAMTADPTSALRAYAIWDRLELFQPTAQQRAALAAAIDSRDRVVIMAGRVLRQMRLAAAAQQVQLPQFKGPAYFTRTLDGGATWERPFIIHDPGANNQTINNLIEVRPDGTVIAFFTEILNLPNGVRLNIALKRSFDHGFSFLPTGGRIVAQRLFTLAIDNPVGTFTPDEREGVRDAGILFDTAVDPDNGNLYLVWQDSRFSRGQIDEIAFSMSTDGGRRWTRPVKINQTPRNRENPFREAAFVPTIAVNADGVLAVTYYDFRNDDGTGELTDQFALFCNPAAVNCARPRNWGQEKRLTDVSFDMLDAPVAPAERGHFLGDYVGSESAAAAVHPAYAVADGVNETSILTRRLDITPSVAAK
jgi:hypothetical protein